MQRQEPLSPGGMVGTLAGGAEPQQPVPSGGQREGRRVGPGTRCGGVPSYAGTHPETQCATYLCSGAEKGLASVPTHSQTSCRKSLIESGRYSEHSKTEQPLVMQDGGQKA